MIFKALDWRDLRTRNDQHFGAICNIFNTANVLGLCMHTMQLTAIKKSSITGLNCSTESLLGGGLHSVNAFYFSFFYRLIDLENCSVTGPQREMNSVFACDLASVLSSPLSGAVLESPSLID